MESVEGIQFYTLTNKDITIKSIGYVVDKIIIKGRELSKYIVQAISEEATRNLQWIIRKWHNDNRREREKQLQEQIIEDNKFLREYIKESEE